MKNILGLKPKKGFESKSLRASVALVVTGQRCPLRFSAFAKDVLTEKSRFAESES